jgi:hypothetical protein
MKWLTRPWLLAAAAAAVVVGVAVLSVLRPPEKQPPSPVAVAAGDREIVWLSYATSAPAWERFVAGVRRAEARLQGDHPGVQAQITDAAFPQQSTAVPEVALKLPGGEGRLVFRWYKLTSDWKTRDWVQALMSRRPPPLAIIGGSSSETARQLAWQLQRHCTGVPDANRPVLLLTTATADGVTDPDDPADPRIHDLTGVFPHRTFRYCFSNKQMAAAVMRFLASQDDLRPTAGPVHVVEWLDDSYSHDLADGFTAALPDKTGLNPERIDSSVGSFLEPNRFEADAVSQVVQDLDGNRGRPLLIVTGQSAPSRRFLRELARTVPAQARRLVVATGDAIAFNTVYRDRRVAWPIQDLPFSLVFFCHFNPIDADAGFQREDGEGGEDGRGTSTTGTEDVLLNGAIVETLTAAFARDGSPAADAAELSARLIEVRHRRGLFGYSADGTPLFKPDGNRRDGTGENIVCLRPRFEAERVLPDATIEVWFSRESDDPETGWVRRPVDRPAAAAFAAGLAGAPAGPGPLFAACGLFPGGNDGRRLHVSYAPPGAQERSGP